MSGVTEDIDILRELRAEYRRDERWGDLAHVLERWRESVVDASRRLELEEELTEAYEFMLGEPSTVAQAETGLERIYRQRDDEEGYRQLAEYYLDKSERHSDEIAAYAAARIECSEVFSDELGDVESALLVITSALGSDVLFAEGYLDRLEELGENTGQWAAVMDAVDEVVEQMPDDARIGTLMRVLARWADRANDERRSLKYLGRAVEMRPNDRTAITRLEEFYRRSGDRQALLNILEKKADALDDPAERVHALLELGRMHEERMDGAADAIDAYQRVLMVAPMHAQALGALDRLYTGSGRFAELTRVLQTRAKIETDPQQRKTIERRLAETLARQGDLDQAIAGFRRAASGARDFASTLKREAEAAESPGAKARLFTELGRLYEGELNDAISAHRYYEKALAADSQIIDAAEPLADAYLRENRFDKAAPLLEAVLRGASPRSDPQWLFRRWIQFGTACDQLGRKAPALDAFREAYELDPENPVAMTNLGRLFYENERWDDALRIFDRILRTQAARIPDSALTGLLYARGDALLQIGERKGAVESLERVIERNPRHRGALRTLVDSYEQAESWAMFVQRAEQLVEVEPERLVRFRQYSRLGEIWGQELNRPDLAMKAYRSALDIDPNSIVVLRKLLELYTQTERYPLAVKVLERLLEHESNPHRMANLHYTAGVLYRDHVGNSRDALSHFDAALDADLEMFKAFEAIDRILTAAREWKSLERAYRRMLKRVTESDQPENYESIELLLWEGLAEIYRSRMGHFESAVNAFQILRARKGDDTKYSLILAELYEKTGNAEGAIQEHRALLQNDPRRIASYRALHNIYLHLNQYDRAWCFSAALSFMHSTLAHEESYYQKYLGQNLRLAHGSISGDSLSKLYHPDQDGLTSSILSYCAERLRPLYSSELKSFGISPKKHEFGEESREVIRKVFDYVCRTLNQPSKPRLFAGEDRQGFETPNVEFPAIIVGQDRLRSSNDRENAFFLGKILMGLRPEHYLAFMGFPAEAIQTLFSAALEAFEPSLGYSKQLKDPNFTRAVKEFRKSPDVVKLQLGKLVASFLNRQEPVDIPAWLNAVEHTTNRAGLLICGDLGQASSCVRYGAISLGSCSDEKRLQELTSFMVSDQHASLRRQIRLAIDDGGMSPWS